MNTSRVTRAKQYHLGPLQVQGALQLLQFLKAPKRSPGALISQMKRSDVVPSCMGDGNKPLCVTETSMHEHVVACKDIK